MPVNGTTDTCRAGKMREKNYI